MTVEFKSNQSLFLKILLGFHKKKFRILKKNILR
jgi:hypothetical protein